MPNLLDAGKSVQALILGVVVIGCATAATVTGHLSGSDLMTVLLTVGTGGAVVAGAHVGGTVATQAATTAPPAVGAGTPAGTGDVSHPAGPAPATAPPPPDPAIAVNAPAAPTAPQAVA